LGTLNKENDNKKHAWVMTVDRDYQTVKFWEPLKPITYTLKGRIKHDESQWLRNYLSPQLSAKEKNKINRRNKKELKRLEKLAMEKEQKEKELEDRLEFSLVLIILY
jgi:hypothetical protein